MCFGTSKKWIDGLVDTAGSLQQLRFEIQAHRSPFRANRWPWERIEPPGKPGIALCFSTKGPGSSGEQTGLPVFRSPKRDELLVGQMETTTKH